MKKNEWMVLKASKQAENGKMGGHYCK